MSFCSICMLLNATWLLQKRQLTTEIMEQMKRKQMRAQWKKNLHARKRYACFMFCSMPANLYQQIGRATI